MAVSKAQSLISMSLVDGVVVSFFVDHVLMLPMAELAMSLLPYAVMVLSFLTDGVMVLLFLVHVVVVLMPPSVILLFLADGVVVSMAESCLLYTSPSPRDYAASRMPSSA